MRFGGVATCEYSCLVFSPAPYQAPVAVMAATDAVIMYVRTGLDDGAMIWWFVTCPCDVEMRVEKERGRKRLERLPGLAEHACKHGVAATLLQHEINIVSIPRCDLRLSTYNICTLSVDDVELHSAHTKRDAHASLNSTHFRIQITTTLASQCAVGAIDCPHV